MYPLIILLILLSVLIFTLVFLLIRFLKVFLPFIFWGGIYVPIRKEKIQTVIELANIKPGERAVDLGSGDGRLLIALARAGAKTFGYEIGPILIKKSRENIKKAGLENDIAIYWENFWQVNLSEFDIVVVYGMRHVMPKLEKKLKRELKKGARVISNNFQFPNWPLKKEINKVYLYEK